ncbi:MAG: tryptophan synthase subunit alpha [Verrucomicrobia bacterium]|nr:tryptophan synthase subunit alpha [Verrucomicrobiota bacterium]
MIAKAFAKGPAFIAYLTLGDGGLNYSLQAALALVKGGVDILEIGVPFSDPVADGPVIQKAMERSLERGTKPQDLISFLRAFRKMSDVPVVIFSYYNPILASGESFLKQAKEAGADGMLIVDLPFDLMPNSDLDPILVVSTSTPKERLQKIVARASGFIYYACQKGTTGMRGSLPADSEHDVERIKDATQLPVAVGFGISKKETANEALRLADAFVVGSYFVDAMSRQATPEELTELAIQIDPRRSP